MKILPPAIFDDTTSIGESAMDDSTYASRAERVTATYHATLRPLWRRGYL